MSNWLLSAGWPTATMGWVWFWMSCVFFLAVVVYLYKIVCTLPTEGKVSCTFYEGMKMFMTVLITWSMFPLINFLGLAHFIPPHKEHLLTVFSDVISKVVLADSLHDTFADYQTIAPKAVPQTPQPFI